jgi:hypothetical protein
MTKLLLAGVLALIPSQLFAQTPGSPSAAAVQQSGSLEADDGLATRTGHEVNVSVSSYNYAEPDAPGITIHGPKIGAEYTGTFSLDKRRHWFAQANVRGIIGSVTYDGWCSPWLIAPNSSSPNGYELDLGDYSACGETGDRDGYIETRGLFGKDFIGQKWAVSPDTGLGLRYLSNGTTGIAGYRTDYYLYLPVGVTARTRVASHGALSFNLEYDVLLHGWQKTRDSELGGGDVPATLTAPEFTIDGFTDISFSQHGGWALRASAKYQVNAHWSVEPYYVRWSVKASPVNYETATFTVNDVTAQEQLGAYEPFNTTNEFGVKFGFPF